MQTTKKYCVENAAEIMQGDFQSSGIFCFATTKRIS